MAVVQNITENTQNLGARARALYERLREKVETPENRGKLIVMDVASDDYEIYTLGIDSARRLRTRHPGANLYALRIGFETTASFGGAPEQITSK